jgi:hypothetical protein
MGQVQIERAIKKPPFRAVDCCVLFNKCSIECVIRQGYACESRARQQKPVFNSSIFWAFWAQLSGILRKARVEFEAMAKPASKLIHQASEFITALEASDATENNLIRFGKASTQTWLEIIRHSEDAAVWVALNKTIPLEMLEVLAKHSSARVRRFAADKNRITPELIALLATDSDPSVRLRIANHKKTSAEILRRLLRDDWDQVVEIAQQRLDVLEQES